MAANTFLTSGVCYICASIFRCSRMCCNAGCRCVVISPGRFSTTTSGRMAIANVLVWCTWIMPLNAALSKIAGAGTLILLLSNVCIRSSTRDHAIFPHNMKRSKASPGARLAPLFCSAQLVASVAVATAVRTAIPALIATTTAGWAFACFVDGDGAVAYECTVQVFDSRAGLIVVAHFDKTKTLAASGITICNDRGGNNLACLLKETRQFLLRGLIGETPHIDSHDCSAPV